MHQGEQLDAAKRRPSFEQAVGQGFVRNKVDVVPLDCEDGLYKCRDVYGPGVRFSVGK